MALVKGCDGPCVPLAAKDHDGRVCQTYLKVSEALTHPPRRVDPARFQRIDQVSAGQVLEESQLGVDPESCKDQVVRLYRREGGDHQFALPIREQRPRRAVIGVGRICRGVQNPGIYDERLRRDPSSPRRMASAERPTGSPLPRATPCDLNFRRRAGAVAAAIASRIISAWDRPVCAARRRSAAASASSRYTVVLITAIYGTCYVASLNGSA